MKIKRIKKKTFRPVTYEVTFDDLGELKRLTKHLGSGSNTGAYELYSEMVDYLKEIGEYEDE